jgi:hypothetical protein
MRTPAGRHRTSPSAPSPACGGRLGGNAFSQAVPLAGGRAGRDQGFNFLGDDSFVPSNKDYPALLRYFNVKIILIY